jgi:hypothetical protein
MTSDKAQRDAANNERFQDRYVHASQEPWIQFYPGIGFKLLRHPGDRPLDGYSELREGVQHSSSRTFGSR